MLVPRETRLGDCTLEQFLEARGHIERLPDAATFEEAAQSTMDALYTAFRPSLVLVRTFITVPYRQLPADIQRSATEFSRSLGADALLKPDTLVLTLAGSAGREQGWSGRKTSRRHQGIPLLSSRFVESSPMVALLLRQVGMGLDWIDTGDVSLIEHGVASRFFHVPDAATTMDKQGRKVIPDQDFVRTHGVKTVFGMGASYIMSQNSLMALVAFCRGSVPPNVVGWFSTITTRLVARTFTSVQAGHLFRP